MDTDGDAKLRTLVERYQVCWQSFPEWSRVHDERKQTGVSIELYGTHEATGVVPTAGCKHYDGSLMPSMILTMSR